MNIEVYYKKIYTVAFRLTGNKNTASEFATQAILKTCNKLGINIRYWGRFFLIDKFQEM